MPEDKFLNDDRLLLASHVIYGCNLKSKAWGKESGYSDECLHC